MDDDDDAAFTPIRRTSMPERFSPVTDSGSPERPSIANQQHLQQQQQQQQLQLPASAVAAAFPSHNQHGSRVLRPRSHRRSSLMFCTIVRRPSTPGSPRFGWRRRGLSSRWKARHRLRLRSLSLLRPSPQLGLQDLMQWILEQAQGQGMWSEADRFLIRSSFRMFCAALAKEQAPTRQYYSRQISRALPRNKHAERSLGALDPCAVPQGTALGCH